MVCFENSQQILRQKCLFSTRSVLHSLTLAESRSHFESVFVVIALCGHLLLQTPRWRVIKLPQQYRPGSPFSLTHNEQTHTNSHTHIYTISAVSCGSGLLSHAHSQGLENPAPSTCDSCPVFNTFTSQLEKFFIFECQNVAHSYCITIQVTILLTKTHSHTHLNIQVSIIRVSCDASFWMRSFFFFFCLQCHIILH